MCVGTARTKGPIEIMQRLCGTGHALNVHNGSRRVIYYAKHYGHEGETKEKIVSKTGSKA